MLSLGYITTTAQCRGGQRLHKRVSILAIYESDQLALEADIRIYHPFFFLQGRFQSILVRSSFRSFVPPPL